MALTQVIKEIANDPDGLKALNKAFHYVEEIPFKGSAELMNAQMFKTFRVKGQGVPDSDTYIRLRFERTLKGETKLTSWDYADKTSLL